MSFTTVYAGGFAIAFWDHFFWRYSYFVIDSVLRYIFIFESLQFWWKHDDIFFTERQKEGKTT